MFAFYNTIYLGYKFMTLYDEVKYVDKYPFAFARKKWPVPFRCHVTLIG